MPLRVDPGVITRMGIQFPRGCAGLCLAQVYHGGNQVWPKSPSFSIGSDDQTIWWDEEFPITDQALLLYLHAWNIDDTYPHTLTWYVQETLTHPAPAPIVEPPSVLQAIKSAFRL